LWSPTGRHEARPYKCRAFGFGVNPFYDFALARPRDTALARVPPARCHREFALGISFVFFSLRPAAHARWHGNVL